MSKIVKALSSITQVSLTMLVPLGMFIWLGQYLVNKHSYPPFVMVIAIITGVISGFYSMIKYLKTVTKEDK